MGCLFKKRTRGRNVQKKWIVENALALCAFDSFLPASEAQAQSALSKRGG
jgi:hypothetical protein